MKHTFLIACLLLFTAHTTYAMETIAKKNTKQSEATHKCFVGVWSNDLDMVKQNLTNGADVNYVYSDGQSIFCRASDSNVNAIIKEIITHKNIDINARDRDGNTPLHLACKLGLSSTVKEILNKNPLANNFYNKTGDIPLQTAVWSQQKDCIELLLSHNSNDINKQNYYGSTALHSACSRKPLSMITLLIEKAADPTIQNNLQETPLLFLYSVVKGGDELKHFFGQNDDIAYKLIHTTDKHNNNQFHLCTSAEITDHNILKPYLLFLITHKLNIHARNNSGKRPVDLACDTYTTFYNQYTAMKLTTLHRALNNQERVMHAFLFITSPFTECALFKAMLEKEKDNEGLPLLLKELMTHIMSDYYMLNIETIVAKKHVNDHFYNQKFIEQKIAIRQQLFANPEPKLLWSAS